MSETAILWFRRDLRLDDNPALVRAMSENARVLPLYIRSPAEESPWEPGGASRWWLHGSLKALDQALLERGSRLLIATGESLEVLARVCAHTGATRVYWNRLYDPATRERDSRIKLDLRERGLHGESHNAALLREPWEMLTSTGGPYKVFTAFWRRSLPGLDDLRPLPTPERFRPLPQTPGLDGLTVEGLGLLPRIPWDQGLRKHWLPGEPAALSQAGRFIAGALAAYAARRDLPGQTGTSGLSAHLHFGEIGPRRLLALIAEHHGSVTAPAAEVFLSEIGWREFAHHLLFHFAHTTTEPLDPRFARFPWRTERAAE